jgi:hypothetical protein
MVQRERLCWKRAGVILVYVPIMCCGISLVVVKWQYVTRPVRNRSCMMIVHATASGFGEESRWNVTLAAICSGRGIWPA